MTPRSQHVLHLGTEPVAARRMLLVLGGLLVLLMGALTALGDLRASCTSYLVIITASTLLLYVVAAWARVGYERHVVLGIALALRLAVLPMLPSLSDDAYRYLWDGRLVAHGIEPFTRAPADTAFARFHDELYRLQAYPTTNTIYPPGAQLLFAASMMPAEITGADYRVGYYTWKLLVILAEMAAIVLMLRTAERLALGMRGVLLYAWHPLVVVELSGQGHTDAFWVLALAIGLHGVVCGGRAGGLPGIALGAATRLHPLTLLPLWMRSLDRQRLVRGMLLSLPLLALTAVLLIPDVFTPYTTVLERFTNHYEFNGGYYLALKGLLDAEHIKPSNMIAGGVCAALAAIAIAAVWLWPVRDRSGKGLAWRALLVVTLQIVLGAKVHVWYFTAPLALLALTARRSLHAAWYWLALAAPFTYLTYTHTPPTERVEVLALEWIGFALLAAWGMRSSEIGERK